VILELQMREKIGKKKLVPKIISFRETLILFIIFYL